MAEAKNNNWFMRVWRDLASYWISWVALGAALATIVLTIFGAVLHPTWTLNFLGIQEKAGESYPTISDQGNIQLAAEASNVFEKLGPVGDYFGGTVNPILTFISIWLLIHSIRIQRDEMRVATTQAEKSVKAAGEAVLVSQVSQRPFIVLDKIPNYDSFHCSRHRNFLNKNLDEDNNDSYVYIFSAKIKNIGKSFAIIKSMEVYLYIKGDDKNLKIGNSFSKPLGIGDTDVLECPITINDNINSISNSDIDSNLRVQIVISYEDSFQIKYQSSYFSLVRVASDTGVAFNILQSSFRDSMELPKASE